MKNCVLSILAFLIFNHTFAKDFGYLDIEVDKDRGTIKTTLDFNPKVLGHLQLPFHDTLGKSFWKTGTSRCQWRDTKTQVISDEKILVSAIAVCPEMKSELMLDLSVLSLVPPDFKILSRINNDGVESSVISSKNDRDIRITPLVDKTFTQYITMGMAQMGAGPRAWQYVENAESKVNNTLFILALIISGATFVVAIKSILGFTLGHAIALMLGTFGVISIPQYLVEPATALSLIVVALQAIVLKRIEYAFIIGLVFGIIHGLVFSAGLSVQYLSGETIRNAFAGLNIGVTLGQLLIVLMAMPVFLMIKRYSNFYPQILRSSTLGVFIFGCYWLVQRSIS